MRFRNSRTTGLSAIGLAAGATLTLATPTANAMPTFPEGSMPPGQMCQQARTVTEDGPPSTIAGMPGVRCGQYLATLPGTETPDDTETEVPETEDSMEDSTERSTEETLEEESVDATTEETTDDEAVQEETTDEPASDGSTAARSGAWTSKHQANNHHGNSKWAHKGKSHPHHPSNH